MYEVFAGALKLVACVILFTTVFWLLWVNFNVLHNRMEEDTGARKMIVGAAFYCLLPVAAFVDVVYNKTVGAVLFLEWGHEPTLSMRLTRYIKNKDKGNTLFGLKRDAIAVWIATRLIEPWQPGHIGLVKYGYPPARNAIVSLMETVRKFLP
jgi:hypothetical protein